jgi:hypothetical protein
MARMSLAPCTCRVNGDLSRGGGAGGSCTAFSKFGALRSVWVARKPPGMCPSPALDGPSLPTTRSCAAQTSASRHACTNSAPASTGSGTTSSAIATASASLRSSVLISLCVYVCVWPVESGASDSRGVGGAQASRSWSSTTCATRRMLCVNWTVRESSALISHLHLYTTTGPATTARLLQRRQPPQPICKLHLRIYTASEQHLPSIFSCSRLRTPLRAERQPATMRRWSTRGTLCSSAATLQRPSSIASSPVPASV